MGTYRPLKANAYVPDTVNRMKQSLADAIVLELDNRQITDTSSIRPFVPSIRASTIRDFRQGQGTFYGVSRLIQIAEGLGLRPEICIKGAT